ncbi:MAG: DUF4159 domain-containing protein [Verrucomicrobia bacterium]|nr:DUF4159 domain-containing protein [Verrucomicrobiota bacterium]
MSRTLLLGLALLAACGPALTAQDASADKFRGGKVEWARLKTDSAYWARHASRDAELLAFIREHTSLNIDRTWYAATARNLDELCVYPFLFSDDINHLVTDTERRNFAEYIHRGGFVFIDACIATGVNPDPDRFYQNQIRLLRSLFPDLRIEALPSSHEVFSIYFKLTEYPPQTRPGNSWSDGPTYPLRALYSGNRMIGMLSLSGLQCGWADIAGHANATVCMEMMTNIYLYAITR